MIWWALGVSFQSTLAGGTAAASSRSSPNGICSSIRNGSGTQSASGFPTRSRNGSSDPFEVVASSRKLTAKMAERRTFIVSDGAYRTVMGEFVVDWEGGDTWHGDEDQKVRGGLRGRQLERSRGFSIVYEYTFWRK